MKDFYDVLQSIRQRPALYLGQNSIFSLQAFLDGYYFARRDLDVPLTAQEEEFQTFLQWMRQKFNVETGQLWASIVLSHSIDERDAVSQFFNLFDEFRSVQTPTNPMNSPVTNPNKPGLSIGAPF
jgi:hypothetical protein